MRENWFISDESLQPTQSRLLFVAISAHFRRVRPNGIFIWLMTVDKNKKCVHLQQGHKIHHTSLRSGGERDGFFYASTGRLVFGTAVVAWLQCLSWVPAATIFVCIKLKYSSSRIKTNYRTEGTPMTSSSMEWLLENDVDSVCMWCRNVKCEKGEGAVRTWNEWKKKYVRFKYEWVISASHRFLVRGRPSLR